MNTLLQADEGLGAKPPEAEAVFRFQRVISTLKHRSGRQYIFKGAVNDLTAPHLKHKTIIW